LPPIRLFGATPGWNGPHHPILPGGAVAPKLAPAIVTAVPTGADGGDRLVMLGGGVGIVKNGPLLDWPATVTTTDPLVAPLGTGTTMLVALQLVGDAVVPLNVTVPGDPESDVVLCVASEPVSARFQICSRLIGNIAGKAGVSE